MADQQPSIPPASGFTSIGNELDPTAPLWRVYRDEVRNHDQTVTFDEWNKTLDILLIFAGLFSAVVTSFLVASYPLLSPEDENETVVNAIHALAKAINSSIALPTPKPPEPVTASILWVNGLWLASLFIALAVAFFANLAKQWLVEYNHRMADPPSAVGSQPTHLDAISPTASLAWARRRQFFFAAFSDWHIPVLITQTLPFLLHVALFLFLIGLSVFVWSLNRRIARGISALTGLLFSLYFIATVLPVFRADCPTATPLVRHATATPLVRRAREAPTWIAIKAVQLWSLILPIALRAFGLSHGTLRNVDGTLNQLRRRQKRIRDSGWVEGGPTTDEEVKLDTLRWLILVSGSETAVTAAFQALGALPPGSRFLPALRTITAGMDKAVERLGNSLIPPTAVEIVRAVRSELILGRGSLDLPLLGLDLSASLTKTLRESQHPDARLLSAAMNLDGMYYTRWDGRKLRSFSSLYDITDTLLKGKGNSDSTLSTVRPLLNRPDISVPAFACLSVLLSQSLHFSDSDKAIILRIFNRLRRNRCYVTDQPHTCDGPCVAVSMVYWLDLEDRASLSIVPIILSYLLPRLMPTSTNWSEHFARLNMDRSYNFFWTITCSDWLQSPCPPGDADVDILSTLLFLWQVDWSSISTPNLYPPILEWLISRRQYGMLHSPSLIEKLLKIRTCDSHKRPSMLQDLCYIVHRVKPNSDEYLSDEDEEFVCTFISSLISLCRDLSPYHDETSRDALFSSGLVPEIAACLGRLGNPQRRSVRLETCKAFFDMVSTALCSLDLDGHLANKEEYLLHLAQHCLVLYPEWMRCEAVGAHLDARRMEELLVQHGPCTKCTEGSAAEWPDYILHQIRARTPTAKQGPQPGPSAPPPRDAPSTLLDPSAPAMLLTTAAPPDLALSSSDTATPNAISVLRVESTPMPSFQAANTSGPVSSSAGSNPVIATLSISPGYAVLVSALDSMPAADAPSVASDATPHAVVVPSSRTSDTPSVAAAPTHIRPLEVSQTTTSPAGLDSIVSPVAAVSHWHPGPASRGDGASTAYVAQDPPSQIPSRVGQGHDDDTTHASRAISSLADDAPSAAAVRMATSSAATSSSSTSALDVPASTASLPTIASSPYAAATTTSSPDSPAAHSQARTADVPTARASPSDPADSDTAGVDVDPGSSAV